MQSVIDRQEVAENIPAPESPSTGPIVWPQVEGLPKNLVGPIDWNHPCSAQIRVVTEDGVRKIKHTKPKRRKVCIVGFAENSRHLAWYDDPECEIWGVNQLYRFIPRADRWFQIHRDWNDKKKWADGTDLQSDLVAMPIPVYMIGDEPDIPNSVAYPKEWVKEQLDCHEYFTSTIAFMLALAIAEGFEEIGIYGIDLIIGREYHFEKACVEFFLGIAHARGIAYHLPSNSALLWQSHTYGYDQEPNYGFYGLEKLGKRAKDLNKIVRECRDKVHVQQGRIEECEFLIGRCGDPDSAKHLTDRLAQLRQEIDKMLNFLYMHDGALQEIVRMHGILELKMRGGSVS